MCASPFLTPASLEMGTGQPDTDLRTCQQWPILLVLLPASNPCPQKLTVIWELSSLASSPPAPSAGVLAHVWRTWEAPWRPVQLGAWTSDP